MKPIIIAMLALLAFTLFPSEVSAQSCQATAFRQFDLAGTYVSPESQMRLEIYPCGGSFLTWSNQFGNHYASYYSTTRLPGGGFAAPGLKPDPIIGTYLDGAKVLGVKPGTPGTIELITMSPYGEILGWYTLRKIS